MFSEQLKEYEKIKKENEMLKRKEISRALDLINRVLSGDYIPKQKIEEKMIIDINNLNHCTNGILSKIYKARIEFAKEILEEK